MKYQYIGRNQRPKGFTVKRALQFALLLAICIWLLYQIKHSRDKKEDYGGRTQSKLGEEDGFVILGRKGNAGWSINGGESGTGDVNYVAGESEKKEDGGGGDDELDRSAEEKAEDESFHKDNEFHRGNVTTPVEKEDEKNNEGNNSDVEVRGEGLVVLEKETSKEEARVSHDKQGDEKDPERQVKETQHGMEDNTDTPVQDKDETVGSYKEIDEDKEGTKSEEKIAMSPSVTGNITVRGQSGMVNVVLGFHDENGVPQDGNDLVESIEDSKIETTNYEEINSETSVHTDT
ncbi:hypothetical protein L1049_023196 [Liquidambar formosana]|uniref:Uncharacterized protein n=1 Tax=Liquidambar formosana TaxID=63359 RepID=A0AAP0RDN6_LIQFO